MTPAALAQAGDICGLEPGDSEKRYLGNDSDSLDKGMCVCKKRKKKRNREQ